MTATAAIRGISSVKDLMDYCDAQRKLGTHKRDRERAATTHKKLEEFISTDPELKYLHSELESTTMQVPGFGPVWSASFLLKFLDKALMLADKRDAEIKSRLGQGITRVLVDTPLQRSRVDFAQFHNITIRELLTQILPTVLGIGTKQDEAAALVQKVLSDLSDRLGDLSQSILKLFKVKGSAIQTAVRWVDNDQNLLMELGDGTKIKMGPKDSFADAAPLFKSIELAQEGKVIKFESRDLDEVHFKDERFYNAPEVARSEPDKAPRYSEWVNERRLIDQDGSILTLQKGRVMTKENKFTNRSYLIEGSTDPQRDHDPKLLSVRGKELREEEADWGNERRRAEARPYKTLAAGSKTVVS